MNRRAAGCLLVGVVAFVAIGLFGLSLALSRGDDCPPQLQWAERVYEPTGTPAASPAFTASGEPVLLGSTFVGLSTRAVYGPPGSSPSERAADRPDRIALECGGGTYQSYAYATDLPAAPSTVP